MVLKEQQNAKNKPSLLSLKTERQSLKILVFMMEMSVKRVLKPMTG